MVQLPNSDIKERDYEEWTPLSPDDFIEQGLKALRFLITSDELIDHLDEVLINDTDPRLCYWKTKHCLPVSCDDWEGKDLDESDWERTFTGFLHNELSLKVAFITFAREYVEDLAGSSDEWGEILGRSKNRQDCFMTCVVHPLVQIFAHAKTRDISLENAEYEFTVWKSSPAVRRAETEL